MEKSSFTNNSLFSQVLEGKSDFILDALPVGVEIYDADATLIYMNETDARIFGADRDEVLVAKVNMFDNPNIPQAVKDAFTNCAEIHKSYPYNFNLATQKNYFASSFKKAIQIECNGRPIFNESGQMDGYVFILEDVTEAIKQEQELKHSKQKTEIAIRDSGIMLWEFDAQKKSFYSDNEPLNAYDRSTAISVEMYIDTLHPDDRQPLQEAMERMIAGDDFTFSHDVRILFPEDPDWQYCTVSGSPYERNAAGRVIRYVGTRKNNTELQKKELLMERILNSIPMPIHIKDVEDNFRYVFCNDESKRMFNTSEDKTTYDVMDDEHVARLQKTDREVFVTGTPYTGLERITLKDGRVYDTIVRKSIIHDGRQRLLLNVRWDQSLQNDLERRAKLLSISMETMNAYVWFFEPDKGIVSFGEGFDRSGRNTSRLDTLEKFMDAIYPEDQLLFENTMKQAIENEGKEWNIEYRIDLNGSGHYEWWHTRGLLESTSREGVVYRYMYGMSINIDSHKQTELKLLCNKEELNNLIRQNELVLNNTNSGLAYITTDYIVQWENISLCSKSLSFEAYKKGEPCYKSAHGRTLPCEDCVMQRAIRSGQVEQIKFPLENNHTVEVFATPVYIDGVVDGIVIRVDDITEREQMIRDLRKAQAQAEQSDKLKSAFLANMSHEIRTPLNAIVGFSELLTNTSDSEDKQTYIGIINSNNELLLKLINDILDLSKIEAGSVELKYEDFDLAEYFDSLAAMMKQRVKNPNVRLIAANPHTTCHVQLDKNRIAQILTNYVTNAIKYTPKGFIEMGYESSDKGIRFYVRDTGIGIAEEKKDKVFHRFEKLDEFAQGTGLGLSICKAIAESMGGSVGFESQFGEGSLFWAFMPCEPQVEGDGGVERKSRSLLHEELSQGEVKPKDQAQAGTPKRYKILIAEDIPSNYLLVSSLLKARYDLIHAENGQEAVDFARDMHPDLILMDMKMPLMGGMEATVEIRKFDDQIPIVALTAHAFDADRQAALAVGCNDYLVKPVNRDQLMEILDRYCGMGR